MCSITICSPDSAFLGFYAVDPKYRSLGIGKILWSKSLERFKDTEINIGLYAVPDMLSKYQNNGFPILDEYKMVIYELRLNSDGQQLRTNYSSLEDNDDAMRELENVKIEMINSETCEKLFNKLVEFDASVSMYSREKLLTSYIWQKSTTHEKIDNNEDDICVFEEFEAPITVALIKKDPDSDKDDTGTVIAYGCIRDDNFGGAMVGPIYANSVLLYELVFKCLLENYSMKSGQLLSAFTLDANTDGVPLLTKLGFEYNRDELCPRLFSKRIPKADFPRIFCIHSPNFSPF